MREIPALGLDLTVRLPQGFLNAAMTAIENVGPPHAPPVMEWVTSIVLKSMSIHDKHFATPKPGVEATLTVRIEADSLPGAMPRQYS
jgi:hypothetical protein